MYSNMSNSTHAIFMTITVNFLHFLSRFWCWLLLCLVRMFRSVFFAFPLLLPAVCNFFCISHVRHKVHTFFLQMRAIIATMHEKCVFFWWARVTLSRIRVTLILILLDFLFTPKYLPLERWFDFWTILVSKTLAIVILHRKTDVFFISTPIQCEKKNVYVLIFLFMLSFHYTTLL